MKFRIFHKMIGIAVISTALISGLLQTAVGQFNFPEPQGRVNDYANIISDETEASLEKLALDLEQNKTAELAIVTMENINGYEISDYTIQLGRSWGVGDKEKDNGIVFLVALEEKEVFIATGYGNEEKLTDFTVKEIIDKHVIPSFKTGAYEAGILEGAKALKIKLENNTPDTVTITQEAKTTNNSDAAIFWYITGFLAFIFITSSTREWITGGVIGIIMSIGLWYFGAGYPSIYISIIVIGLALDYYVSKRPWIKWMILEIIIRILLSGGSGGSGSSRRGSSSSRGFGGGSFGGGGSGGKW